MKGLLLVAAVTAAGCAARPAATAPPVSWVPDASYHVLMAEIAARRGQHQVAAQEYLNAARQTDDAALARRATRHAFDYGYEAYARGSAARWVALEPDNPEARFFLGRLELRRRAVAAAAEQFEAALGPASQRGPAHYRALSSVLDEEDDPWLTTALLVRLRQSDSAGPLELIVARHATRAGRHPLAETAARRALSAADGPLPEIVLARALLAAGDAERAIARLEGLVEDEPRPVFQLELARLEAEAGRTAAALERLESMAGGTGTSPELLRMRALIHRGAGDIDAAWVDFSELLSSGHDVYECFWFLGDIAIRRGWNEQAMTYLTRIAGGPYFVPARTRIATLHAESGDVERGDELLATLAETHPRLAWETYYPRAQLLMDAGRDEAALAVLDRALVHRPRDPAMLIVKGMLLDRMQRVDEAIATLREAQRAAPDDANVLNTLGYTLADRNRELDEAHRLIRQAVEMAPESGAILDSMGWVLFRLGRLDEARSYLSLAWRRDPGAEIAAHLGEVLWRLGEREAARAAWDEGATHDADNPVLRDTLERLGG